MLEGLFALHPSGSANHGDRGLGDSAGHVDPRATMLEQPGLVDTMHVSSYSPEANYSSHQEADAGTMATQAQNWSLGPTAHHQTHRETAPTVLHSATHQGNHEWTDRAVPVIPTYDLGTHIVSRQDEVFYNVGVDGNNADVGALGVSEKDSHGPELPLRSSDPGQTIVQSQSKATASSESVACPICNTRLQDKSGLRFVTRST